MVFLAGKSPNIRCIYTVLANPRYDGYLGYNVEYVGYMVIHGMVRVGHNHIYIWCIYGAFVREIT